MYVSYDELVGVYKKQIMELEEEKDQLQAELVQLKNDLRITREGRQFFYKDAKAEHMRAERLQAENNRLRAQLAAYHSSDDKYCDDFIDENEIIMETMKRC